MRTPYQQKKWTLFKEIESTKDKKERSRLLAKFNNMIQTRQENTMYQNPNQPPCQYCKGDNVKRIYARDEYYDICQDCENEQEV